MRYVFSVILCVVSLAAQAYTDMFNADSVWKKFVFESGSIPEKVKQQYVSGNCDSCLIMVSNRKLQKDSLRFMSEYRDAGRLYYLLLVPEAGQWKAYRYKKLEDAIGDLASIHHSQDWLVYAEGMGKIFTANADRAQRMSSLYDVNVIMFDYPSITTTLPARKNYKFALENSKSSATEFYRMLTELRRIKTREKDSRLFEQHLSIFMHSMGNNLLKEMVKTGTVNGLNKPVWVSNLILNAACIDQKGHAKMLEQVKFASHIIVNSNPNDKLLKRASLLTMSKQLGTKVKAPLSAQATYINFSGISGQEHNYFLDVYGKTVTPTAGAYFKTIVHGNVPEWKDTASFTPAAHLTQYLIR